MTDDVDELATAFLVGFCGFAWTFAAAFWSVQALAPLAVLTFLTWRQVERSGWLSVSVGSQERHGTPAADGGRHVPYERPDRGGDGPTENEQTTTAGDRKPPRGN